MSEFQLGARVRVLVTSPTSYAGRTGEVAWASRTRAGAVYAYHVKLDGSSPGSAADLEAVFHPHEPKPELNDTTEQNTAATGLHPTVAGRRRASPVESTNMALPSSQQQQVRDWLTQHNARVECPVCSGMETRIEGTINPKATPGASQWAPFVTLVCERCAYTRFFSAFVTRERLIP
jgi:predicted nucleic-acid-binding Zn-ribbon protein